MQWLNVNAHTSAHRLLRALRSYVFALEPLIRCNLFQTVTQVRIRHKNILHEVLHFI